MANRLNLVLSVVVGGLAIHGIIAACGSTGSSKPDAQSADAAEPSDAAIPAGTIMAFGGTTAPAGWMLCDGSAVSRTTYATLFAAIGIAWGGGDGVTTYNLPDLRGRFLRGVDGGTGRDPDAASRTVSAPAGNTGDAVGSIQADQFQGHGHVHELPNNSVSNPQGTFFGVNGTNSYGSGRVREPATFGAFGTARFGTETRPINAYVTYLIRL